MHMTMLSSAWFVISNDRDNTMAGDVHGLDHLSKLMLPSELQTHILTRVVMQESQEEWFHCSTLDLPEAQFVAAKTVKLSQKRQHRYGPDTCKPNTQQPHSSCLGFETLKLEQTFIRSHHGVNLQLHMQHRICSTPYMQLLQLSL